MKWFLIPLSLCITKFPLKQQSLDNFKSIFKANIHKLIQNKLMQKLYLSDFSQRKFKNDKKESVNKDFEHLKKPILLSNTLGNNRRAYRTILCFSIANSHDLVQWSFKLKEERGCANLFLPKSLLQQTFFTKKKLDDTLLCKV